MIVIVVRLLAEADGGGHFAEMETGDGNTYFARGPDPDAAARELARALLDRGFDDTAARVHIRGTPGHVSHARLSVLAGTGRPARRFVVRRPPPHAPRR